MKKQLIALLASLPLVALSAEIEGDWLTIDDESGEARSKLRIEAQSDGTFAGHIVDIFNPSAPIETLRCTACQGELAGQPMLGLPLIWGLQADGDKYDSGRIVDPESGKVYRLSAKVNDAGALEVRGFIGISLIGRTQTWQPAD